jgi:hypothetical protein
MHLYKSGMQLYNKSDMQLYNAASIIPASHLITIAQCADPFVH